MRIQLASVALLCVSMCGASSAYAEGTQPVYGQPGQPVPTAQPQNVPIEQQPPPQQQQPTRQTGRGIEYGAHLLVPIWPDSRLHISPGFGIQGRFGWEFPGGFTVEVNGGLMGNSKSFTDGLGSSVNATLTNFWIGGGLRYAFLNASAFVPFVGVGIALNFWGASGNGVSDSLSSTFSANALVGFAYEISQYIALEAGVQGNYTSRGDVFPAPGVPFWVSPFFGGTLYY